MINSDRKGLNTDKLHWTKIEREKEKEKQTNNIHGNTNLKSHLICVDFLEFICLNCFENEWFGILVLCMDKIKWCYGLCWQCKYIEQVIFYFL